MCIESALNNYLNTDLPYRAHMLILETEDSDVAFMEYRSNERVLFFDWHENIFCKKQPARTSEWFMPFATMLSEVDPKKQIFIFILFSTFLYIASVLQIDFGLSNLDSSLSIVALVSLFLGLMEMIMAAIYLLKAVTLFSAYKHLEEILFLPFKDVYSTKFPKKDLVL